MTRHRLLVRFLGGSFVHLPSGSCRQLEAVPTKSRTSLGMQLPCFQPKTEMQAGGETHAAGNAGKPAMGQSDKLVLETAQ